MGRSGSPGHSCVTAVPCCPSHPLDTEGKLEVPLVTAFVPLPSVCETRFWERNPVTGSFWFPEAFALMTADPRSREHSMASSLGIHLCLYLRGKWTHALYDPAVPAALLRPLLRPSAHSQAEAFAASGREATDKTQRPKGLPSLCSGGPRLPRESSG